ncbi:MAG: helix-turn-helix domain-containing protein, partial [Myxococcota bacterium]
VKEGYEIALRGKQKGTPKPRKIDGDVEAKIIALTRMSNEDGTAGYTYQGIANQMVEQGYIESISHESVRQVLKKTHLSRISNCAG